MQDISKDTEMFDNVNVLLETLAEDECNPVVVPASEAISCCEHMLNTVLSTLFDNKQKTYQKSAVFWLDQRSLCSFKKVSRSHEVAEEKSEAGSNDQME